MQLVASVSRTVLLLVALIFIDDADLCVFNVELDVTKELVLKAQKLLDAWHSILMLTGRNLKL